VDRLDPRLDALLGTDAVVEKIADGFQFIEGPVWVGDAVGGHLLFSDIPGDKVYRWSETAGTSVFLEPVFLPELATNGQGGSNGLTLDHSGRVVLCEHGNRRVARLEEDGSRTTLADHYEGKRLNSPNDIVYHSSGAAFFTDPPYGLAGPEAQELDWQGIYRLDPDGGLHLLARGQTRPNGIGLAPDEQTLYVANSDREAARWWAYPVANDMSLGEGRVLLDLTGTAAGVPDGLAIDSLGNIWGSGPGGLVIISPEGDHLGTVRVAEQPANAAFGGDGRTLYITARTALYRIRTLVAGLMPQTAAR
jgi:gluconolactonase